MRPPEFGPGEFCGVCIHFKRPSYCMEWKETVDEDDWCNTYKSTDAHIDRFRQEDIQKK